MEPSKVDRRSALSGLAVAAATTVLPAQAKAADKPDGYAVPKPEIDGKALVNRPRATEVLERFGLAGMIALSPINVYYLTNVRTI
ncbi:MAG: hypothetical protein HN793_07185, partial [Rhodospirillaceae bacterium]|nr:hypothetical protein [Rhodospirillaceae bacterium]